MLDETAALVAEANQSKIIRQGTAGLVSSPDARMGTAAPERAPGSSGATHITPPGERWYAVRHKVHEAPVARFKIRRLGFQTHWPRFILRRPRRDDVITPLFPGYLFVRFDLRKLSWGPITAIPEVVGMLGAIDGRPPVPVPVGEIEKLVERSKGCDRVIDETPDEFEDIKPDGPVLIVDGVLSGKTGLLRGDKGEARVSVLMTMMGVEREVILPRRSVRRAEAS